jgi:hypothetical protein
VAAAEVLEIVGLAVLEAMLSMEEEAVVVAAELQEEQVAEEAME